MRTLGFLFTLALTLSTGLALAENPPADAAPSTQVGAENFVDQKGFFFNGRFGLNLLQGASNFTGNSNRISILGGVSAEYFFVPRIGVFAGTEINSRGYKSGSRTDSAMYLDFPFGVVFNTTGGSWMSGSGNRIHFRLGGYLAVPTNDFSGTLNLGVGSQKFFGLYLGSDCHFLVTPNFSLGFGTWGKIGLGSAITGSIESKFVELGIGLVGSFF